MYSREQPFDLRNIRVRVEAEYTTDPQTRICTGIYWFSYQAMRSQLLNLEHCDMQS